MPRKRPIEYSILYTATLCLLAGGAVMVYSASSAESLLHGNGDPSFYLKRYGFFGVGLGESVQKIFYLPEAHTDMILAIIGEELGLLGILGVIGLYGMIAYAGLRTAKLARDLY